MSYKIKFFLFVCMVGTIKPSNFGASCSSDEFQEADNKPVQAVITCALIRSEGSLSQNEIIDRSSQIHKVEQEIDKFQRELRRKVSGLQFEYEELSNNPLFLTNKKFVETKVGSFILKVADDEKKDQEAFNLLSKKVSSLRGSFRTRLSEEKNILSEEDPVDSLIGSLRVVAREHGFKENPFLEVPFLKLNGSKLYLKPEQEGERLSVLSMACNLGSGIRQVDSTTDDKNIAIDSKNLKTKKSRFTLKENFIDNNFSSDSSDLDSDRDVVPVKDVIGDYCPGITRKESSNHYLVSLEAKKANFKNMNDDDSDYE